MTTHTYHNPEHHESHAIQTTSKHVRSWLVGIFDTVFDLLLVEPNMEPKILELQGRNGDVFWEIHDARTGRTVYCMTEFEVLEWLDSRSYRL